MSIRKKRNISFTKKTDSITAKKVLELLPILLTIGVIPFLVRIHTYNPNLDQFSWYYNSAEPLFGDTFLYYRQWFFTGLSFYMLLVLIGKFIINKKEVRFSITALPMGIYALFAFLSSVFSDYRNFSFSGIFEQFENVFVLMGYALIVYYSFIVLKSENDLKIVLCTLTGSTFFLSLIGTCQTFGYDFYGTELMKYLSSPDPSKYSYEPVVGENTAYLSLYNPNYVGVYVAILFPIFTVLLFFSKKWWQVLLYCLTIVFLLISLYGSGSKAGFLVLGGLVFLLIIFMRRPIFQRWYIVVPSFLLLVVAFLFVNYKSNNSYIHNIVTGLTIKPYKHPYQEMTTEEDGIHITYQNEELVVGFRMEENDITFLFLDSKGEVVQTELMEDMMTFNIIDPRFKGFKVYPVLYYENEKNIVGFCINTNGREWCFSNQYDDSGTYYYVSEKGKFDRMIMAEQVLFNDYETIFSGRGYIWSVTIPLLKNKIILGSGADTFMIEFPHQDYLRLWRNGYNTLVMSKPHCLYLQVGVQTGVISLIALLTFFIMYGISSIRLFINSRFETFYEQVGVAVFLSVIGFAVTGITNDSCVAVSPIFWAIAGMGVFVNAKCKEMKKNKVNTND